MTDDCKSRLKPLISATGSQDTKPKNPAGCENSQQGTGGAK